MIMVSCRLCTVSRQSNVGPTSSPGSPVVSDNAGMRAVTGIARVLDPFTVHPRGWRGKLGSRAMNPVTRRRERWAAALPEITAGAAVLAIGHGTGQGLEEIRRVGFSSVDVHERWARVEILARR